MARLLLSAALLLTVAGRADAESGVVDVAGDTCEPETVAEHLRALQTGREDTPDVSVVWRTDDDGIHARIRIAERGGAALGERDLVVNDCSELSESVSLMVGMVLAHPVPPRVAPATAPPAVVHNSDKVEVEEEDSEPRANPTRLGFVASAAVTHRAIPTFSAGLRVAKSDVSIGLEIEASETEQVHVSDGTARIRYLGARLLACSIRGSFDLCALARLDRISGEGSGYVEPLQAASFGAAGGANVGWRLRISSGVTLRPYVEAVVWATQNRFHVDDMEVWDNGPWEGRVGLALDASIL